MIEVVYNRELHTVTLKGHAYSGEKGHDLVCASASILAHALAANVANLEASGLLNCHRIELKEGEGEIRCKPVKSLKSTVMLIFDTICGGFELLSRSYPENISYKIM